MSKAPSTVVSITKSEVSQVDTKFKSNATKLKVKSLLKSVDTEKTGLVKHEVFFELLELHGIKLSKESQNYLKNNFSKNQSINYKEALNKITIDLDAAGDNELKWTTANFQKK